MIYVQLGSKLNWQVRVTASTSTLGGPLAVLVGLFEIRRLGSIEITVENPANFSVAIYRFPQTSERNFDNSD